MPQKFDNLSLEFHNFPFVRLTVYNGVNDPTYVYWDLHRNMRDKGEYSYQLQVARTPNPQDTEWENVGSQETNPAFLTDSVTPSYGYVLDKYYRIILTTGEGKYVSDAFGCFGQLTKKELKIAKEVRRKEKVRAGYTAVPVTVFQKKRYGEPCPVCSHGEDGGSSNSKCEYCFGTGYLGGYHNPFLLQVMDISPSRLMERHYSNNTATYNIATDRYQARAAGIPELYEGDIVWDRATGQRFRITAAPVIAQIHRVPLVREVDMTLLPYSDMAYSIGMPKQSSKECGAVPVNENFTEPNELACVDSEGNPISGATITIKDSNNEVVSDTKSMPDGSWQSAINLNPGEYTVEFESERLEEPVTKPITVTEEQAMEDETYSKEKEMEDIDYLNLFE